MRAARDAAFGAMLGAAALAFEVAARAAHGHAYRLAAAIAIGAGFVLVWINFAVGVIGREDNPANLAFAAVLGLGLAGAALVRLRAAGLARVLAAMAALQGAIGVYALAVASYKGAILCLLYVATWLTSAQLFRKAAENA